jgi:hypothetical protein
MHTSEQFRANLAVDFPDLRGFSEAGGSNASGFARGLHLAGRAARRTAEEVGWAVEQMRSAGLESDALAR